MTTLALARSTGAAAATPRHQRPRPVSRVSGVAGTGLLTAVALPVTAGAMTIAAAPADAAVHASAAPTVKTAVVMTAAVKTATSTSAVPTLRYGSTGSAVSLVQQRVTGLVVDGVFGPKTLAAVKSFQSSRQLVVDGIVGPITWKALGGYTGTSTSRDDTRTCVVGATLRYNVTSSAVRVVQSALGLEVDGWFGPKTLAAVKAFQAAKTIPVTGLVDAATWKALGCTGATAVPTVPPPVTGAPALNLARADMWDRIAWCESGQRWSLVATNSTGTYHGGLMMTHDAWRIGDGLKFAYDAHLATREQQITVANNLYAKLGLKPWSCRGAA